MYNLKLCNELKISRLTHVTHKNMRKKILCLNIEFLEKTEIYIISKIYEKNKKYNILRYRKMIPKEFL